MSIPSYTFFSILMKSCTCGRMIGCYQKEIEENIERELLNTQDLREAKLIVLKNMGFSKICCLDKIINCPKVTINDTEGEDSYVDITNFQTNNYQNNRIKGIYNNESWGFLPRTRGKIEFNHDKYCDELTKILFEEHKTISKTIISDFPKIFAKIIPEHQQNQL